LDAVKTRSEELDVEKQSLVTELETVRSQLAVCEAQIQQLNESIAKSEASEQVLDARIQQLTDQYEQRYFSRPDY
jgi:chromosome segregation ATPase